ncbi:dicer-like 2 [Euphorbia peplus]|nr:dicer-like 2 [Euphorbia peplus]
MDIHGDGDIATDDTLSFARNYQLEAFEKAKDENTIVYLETGSGKTLIAIMLLRSHAYMLRKPSPFIAVFLVPKVVLVKQQADAVKMHTDLTVAMYWGEMGVDFWDAAIWKEYIDNNEVHVMTPQIFLDGLRHSFFKLDWVKVLIFDECHHVTGGSAYACILREFYHPQLESGSCNLPRIFGMTASPVNSKGSTSELFFGERIRELENMMHSKVYTCKSEAVLAEFIPFSTTKFRYYDHEEIPFEICAKLANKLRTSKEEFVRQLNQMDLICQTEDATKKKLSKLYSKFIFCLEKLGVWLAFKAAEILSSHDNDSISMELLGIGATKIIKEFGCAASTIFFDYVRTAVRHLGPNWSIGDNFKNEIEAGLLTEKVFCLFQTLLEYRDLSDIRCIVFVERIITARVLESLLIDLLPRYNGWKTRYLAGNNCRQSQTRKTQNEIVQQFRDGEVNIIIATSILEEGLDVQSCNLVIRFDPSSTVSSFIQSKGRARMKNSDYVLMVKNGDSSTYSKLRKFLASGEIMRNESLRYASVPCLPPKCEFDDDEYYCVESTEAKACLASSVSLIHFYCSRLPSDGYFKPSPRCILDKEMGICTLILPKSCPIQTVRVEGSTTKYLKKKACLEACKQLHQVGALDDNLVPDTVIEAMSQEVENMVYDEEQPRFFPPELVKQNLEKSGTTFYCHLIELTQNFDYDILAHNIVLVTRSKLDIEILSLNYDLEVDGGLLMVKLKYIGKIELQPEMVLLCRKFVISVFKILRDNNIDKLEEMLTDMAPNKFPEREYFLLPYMSLCPGHSIDWNFVVSVLFSYENVSEDHKMCPFKDSVIIHTESGPVCKCMLQNSLVCTPHNGKIYCITGILDDLNGCSLMKLRNGSSKTYKDYYKDQYGIKLCFERELLLCGRHIFPLHNYICKGKKQKGKDSQNAYVQLPPELCRIIMSPLPISTLYSFTFFPSIMHRLESMLIAMNLKQMQADNCAQNVVIPTIKVLEAITTKKCQEKFNMESLETLGDSFLKYATSQQLFQTFQNQHEGLLSIKKDKIISNANLCKLGCDCKLPGFIRNEYFDPKIWMIPGDSSGSHSLNEETLSDTRKIYLSGKRKIKKKTVADVVEALIGAYVSCGGEVAGLIFLNWIGIKVEFLNLPYERQFQVKIDRLINVQCLESLLNYSFRDPSLLLEALTHGSYMVVEIPRCYQRLEYLGDSVLDYLVTVYLYEKYPGLSPGLLTDLRSASVNNDTYALCALRKGLHKHILHASQKLRKDIDSIVTDLESFSSPSTSGWDSEISFPKVLGDVVESLAGAIFVDSGYNKEVVFKSIRPLLEPLVTPETIKLHPVRELTELCQKEHFNRKKSVVSRKDGMSSVTVEVEANGVVFTYTSEAGDRKTGKRLASKEVLTALKNFISATT